MHIKTAITNNCGKVCLKPKTGKANVWTLFFQRKKNWKEKLIQTSVSNQIFQTKMKIEKVNKMDKINNT